MMLDETDDGFGRPVHTRFPWNQRVLNGLVTRKIYSFTSEMSIPRPIKNIVWRGDCTMKCCVLSKLGTMYSAKQGVCCVMNKLLRDRNQVQRLSRSYAIAFKYKNFQIANVVSHHILLSPKIKPLKFF